MWGWIKENAEALEATAAIMMAVVAVAALVGVKLQIDATDRIQQEQAAREIYREFLALSVNKPELADADYCEIDDAKTRIAYEHYVEYLLYTAEHVIEMDEDWYDSIEETLERHDRYICNRSDWHGYSPSVQSLIEDIQENTCTAVPAC